MSENEENKIVENLLEKVLSGLAGLTQKKQEDVEMISKAEFETVSAELASVKSELETVKSEKEIAISEIQAKLDALQAEKIGLKKQKESQKKKLEKQNLQKQRIILDLLAQKNKLLQSLKRLTLSKMKN